MRADGMRARRTMMVFEGSLECLLMIVILCVDLKNDVFVCTVMQTLFEMMRDVYSKERSMAVCVYMFYQQLFKAIAKWSIYSNHGMLIIPTSS